MRPPALAEAGTVTFRAFRVLAVFLPVMANIPLACPLTAVVGADDAAMTVTDMAGWSAVIMGPFDGFEGAGGHLALLDHGPDVLAPIYARAEHIRPIIRSAHGIT